MQLECTIQVHQVETLELQFKQERGTNFTTRKRTCDLSRGPMEPQRIAYILVVEGSTKALSLYKLLTLLKRITKIELEVSTKLHKGNTNIPVRNHNRLGAP